jgi:hypothetical protein
MSLLHEVLTNQTNLADVMAFWPEGYILPCDASILRQRLSKNHNNNDKKEWILKERAGYGSHGNQLESTKGSSASYWCSWVLAGNCMGGIDANRVVNVDVAPCFFERIL